MKQYNIAFYDEARTKPCSYIVELNPSLFEGFFLEHSIGTFDTVEVAARMVWYITQLMEWMPSAEDRKRPN